MKWIVGAALLGLIGLSLSLSMALEREKAISNSRYIDNSFVSLYLENCVAELTGTPPRPGSLPPENYAPDDCEEIGPGCPTHDNHQ